MDAYEATRVVMARIQALDPENAAKIMGLLLLQDHGEKEMIRLAFGPEPLLLSLVHKARKDLGLDAGGGCGGAWNPLLLARQNSGSRLVAGSPSAWPDGNEELMSPTDSSLPSPSYGDLVDELHLQDHLGLGYHRRSFSAADMADAAAGYGWRPCLYYARGYCKNGGTCRFVHGFPDDGGKMDSLIEQQCHELLLRSRSHRVLSSPFPFSPAGSLPPSPSSPTPRSALMMMRGEEAAQRLMACSPRMARTDLAAFSNPSSRQIYLTFPADSTFREEDVSNYFSIYGPVQDVRIPYQQKRMFGFVTFVYPETVKLILAKGNPHFVCDARVLVKPYKEKGKIADKKQHNSDFIGGSGMFEARDTLDGQSLGLLCGGSLGQETLLRRRMESQQHAAQLQHAIDLQSQRFMGLHLKPRGLHSNNNGEQREVTDKPSMSMAAHKGESAGVASTEAISFPESSEHNLPDSPFASPKSSGGATAGISETDGCAALDMASPFSSCFYPIPPRLSSSHGAVRM